MPTERLRARAARLRHPEPRAQGWHRRLSAGTRRVARLEGVRLHVHHIRVGHTRKVGVDVAPPGDSDEERTARVGALATHTDGAEPALPIDEARHVAADFKAPGCKRVAACGEAL